MMKQNHNTINLKRNGFAYTKFNFEENIVESVMVLLQNDFRTLCFQSSVSFFSLFELLEKPPFLQDSCKIIEFNTNSNKVNNPELLFSDDQIQFSGQLLKSYSVGLNLENETRNRIRKLLIK